MLTRKGLTLLIWEEITIIAAKASIVD